MEEEKGIVAVGLGEVLFDCDLDSKEENFGGAPANFAYHFLKCSPLVLGPTPPRVYVVSAIGVDEAGVPDQKGQTVLGELETRGLNHCLTHVKGHATGVANKRRNSAGVNTYDILPAAWDHIEWTEELKQLARSTDVVCFGSLSQRKKDKSRDTVRKFLDEMIDAEREAERTQGGKTLRRKLRVFDVNIRQNFYSADVIRESFKRCNVLKVSDEEFSVFSETLTGFRFEGNERAFCQALLERYKFLKLIILTEGNKGSRIFAHNRVSAYVIPEKNREKPFDTVGAGDSFMAAFCAMYLSGRDIWEAQLFASRVAAYVCSQASATPPYPASPDDYFFGPDSE